MEKRSSPPRKLKIKGQPHKLAYINDVEEGLLRARGGTGEMVHGIPAFYSDDDDAFDGAAMESFQDDFGGGGASDNEYQDTPNLDDLMAGAAARNRINAANAATIAAAQKKQNVQQVYDDTNYGAATKAQLSALANSFINSRGTDGKNIFAPSIYSNQRVGGSIGNFLKGGGFNSLRGTSLYSNYFDDPSINKAIGQAAIDQIQNSNRVQNAKDGYGMPIGGTMFGAVGGYNVQNIQDKIAAGGRPVLDENGVVQGVFHEGLFGGEVYSGNPVAGIEATGSGIQGGGGDEVKEPNPLTGQCDEGYFFDEDLQACRMGSATASTPAAPVTAPATGAYYRPTGLETAPAFTPAGFDYDAANSAFLDSYAYRPDNYQDPMSLNGFKQIT